MSMESDGRRCYNYGELWSLDANLYLDALAERVILN